MSKFKVGDEIYLSVDPWEASRSKETPFNIVDRMWKQLATTQKIVVRNLVGRKNFGGYGTPDAIALIFDDHDTDRYVFPSEFFSLKKCDLFSADDNFLI